MKKGLAYLLIFTLITGIFLVAAIQRTAWDEDFVVEDGKSGTAYFSDISWRYWGSPHALSIGGQPISCAATFRLGEHHCVWKSNREERVFIVQFSLQRWYAVSLDRTDRRKWVVRFYSGTDGGALSEIEPRDYPVKLAIQNLWLNEDTQGLNSSLTSGNPRTRFCLLAKTWWKLVHKEDVDGVEPGFIEWMVSKEFPGRTNFLPQMQNEPTNP